MGAVGQFVRLAKAPHGVILAPQIDLLPTDGKGLGRTCTLESGGMAVSRAVAQDEVPDANIVLFDLDLSELQADKIADQLVRDWAKSLSIMVCPMTLPGFPSR